MCYRTGKYAVCKRVRASFSPEIVRAGAVKGLKYSLEFLYSVCISLVSLTTHNWTARLITTATRSRIAQSVERPTEKPGAIVTWVRIPGAARDFSSRITEFSV